ncbi:thioredoxin family protein [Rhodothermus profundi]|uniref:Thioredoxin-related protein n=1 Tax=Rhodothermus profundi TaxID=633813 RepID=A0A1M6QK69_9BACT|nr:thioredoxin fold domain-containing protein [Rhodothermus profundi]SHK20427.1 Thioredoxin-related protein [Rhodothermus profundi]
MRRSTYLCWLSLTVLLPLTAQAQSSLFDPAIMAPIGWQRVEEAMAAAAQSGKKVLIDISAPWCPWCRRMQKEVYADSAVVAYLKAHFEYARLNGEDTARKLTFRGYELTEAELAQALGLSGYPTTVFLEPDGTYITRVPGFVPTETFLQILRFIGSEAYRTQSFEEFMEQQR